MSIWGVLIIVALAVLSVFSLCGIFEWANNWWQYLLCSLGIAILIVEYVIIVAIPQKLEDQIILKRGYYIDGGFNKVYVDKDCRDVKKVPPKIMYDE